MAFYYSPEELVAMGLSRKDVLLHRSGWRKPDLRAEDRRRVIDLNPTLTLYEVRKHLSNRSEDFRPDQLQDGWTNKEAAEKMQKMRETKRAAEAAAAAKAKVTSGRNLRAQVMKPVAQQAEPSKDNNASWNAGVAEMQHQFIQQVVEDAALGLAAAEARNAIGRNNPQLLEKMFARKAKEEAKSEIRRHRLNSLGIFDPEVNEVRNRNIQRVNLKHGLTEAALKEEEAVKGFDPLSSNMSLEARLGSLLEVITLVVDGPPKQLMSDADLAGAAVRVALSQRQSNKSTTRIREVEAVSAQMLSRYRQRVHEEQTRILQDLGVDPSQPETWSQTLETMEEERQETEALRARQERESDDRGEVTAQNARNTEELMEAVLSRLSIIEERMAEQEALASQIEAEKRREAGHAHGELDEDEDNPSQRLNLGAQKQQGASRPQTEAPPPAGSRQAMDDGVRPRKLPDHNAPGAGFGSNWMPPIVKEASQGDRPMSEPSGAMPPVTPAMSTRSRAAGFYIPSEEELDAEPPTSLPAIMQLGGMTPADVLQARLERIWGLLEMPMMAKLDMVIKYTSQEISPKLEHALDIWESAAAAVVERERLLGVMVDMQECMETGDISRKHFTPQFITDITMTFLVMSHNARKAAWELHELFSDKLTFQGMDYPGEDAVTDEQLSTFVQSAMQTAADYYQRMTQGADILPAI